MEAQQEYKRFYSTTATTTDNTASNTTTVDEFNATVEKLLSNKKRIFILCGAGLSVSCGIPDFRSPKGLYNTLDISQLELSCAEDLFDLNFFQENPVPFYKFAKEYLFVNKHKPSIGHYVLRLLQKRIQRLYTQNIDGLEEKSGFAPKKIIYAHGNVNNMTCLKCKKSYVTNDVLKTLNINTINGESEVPLCSRFCKQRRQQQQDVLPAKKSRSSEGGEALSTARVVLTRSSSSSRMTSKDHSEGENASQSVNEKIMMCNGVLKPNITFFGEKLGKSVTAFLEKDKKTVDAVIVIGTSLSVAPMSGILEFLPDEVPKILINKNEIKGTLGRGYKFDASFLGNCDDILSSIAVALGMESKLNEMLTINDSSCSAFPLFVRPISFDSETSCFYFPGSSSGCERESDGNAEEAVGLKVMCDGCNTTISGDGSYVMKCTVCFDYDLCINCYETEHRNHFSGAHEFAREKP